MDVGAFELKVEEKFEEILLWFIQKNSGLENSPIKDFKKNKMPKLKFFRKIKYKRKF